MYHPLALGQRARAVRFGGAAVCGRLSRATAIAARDQSANPEDALLEFARSNNVDLIVLGAPHPAQLGLAWWRPVASRVTANAHCSVHVVRVPERATD